MRKTGSNATSRRRFLSQLPLAVTGSALALGQESKNEEKRSVFPSDAPTFLPSSSELLPTIRLGDHEVTRLIAGSNPISGYSYLGPLMDRHMKEYFTPEQTAEFLWNCERAGINTHQFSDPETMAGVLGTLRERGSKMKFICLHSGQPQSMPIEQVVRDTQPIALAHHGGVTDRLFREGKSQEVRDYTKRVHDAGVLVGVSAHNPDCIKRIADEGWQVDFFMACFYYLTRPKETLGKMAVGTLPVGSYAFFASDPIAMTEVVRQVDPPCLGFKILAAGRQCGNSKTVKEAFQFAFERLKPTDGVIVGMYPRFSDQVSENAEYVRQINHPPSKI